ncbi:uncharacterized protein LOC124297748 [Neodiprion virginianus]|uniref:uncharacterized protein LOC124297748 n=1 Tax=Neodiprion virginianus TaxID=2961670 RepID=UPI001EE77454|nr:uncharacterized protein LOC124297748 [Neodiprion virginianus]
MENGRASGSQADDTATGEVPVVEPQGDARRAEDVDPTTTRAETPPNPGVDESGGLAENVLKAMGKRIAPDRVLGPELPKPIAVRWEEIFKQGLPPELKTSIIEKYLPPSNCMFIDPPKVNPELKAASTEAVVKRDNRIISKQERIAACLSAQGKALATIIKRDNDADLALIESISDTARLLADLQREETAVRKSLILAPLKISVKDALQNSTTDEWLCGKDLEDRLRSAKNLERSLNELKPATKNQTPKNSKNFKTPPRYQAQKTQSGTTGGQKYTGFQAQKKYPSQRTQPSQSHHKPYQRRDNNSQNRRRVPIEPARSPSEKQETLKLIDDLLKKGAIAKCNPAKNQFISNIFLRPKPDGSKRLIINLKELNTFVITEHFKMEDRKTALRLISPQCFMATLDLKDAYYLIPLAKTHRKYIRFQLDQQYFEFTCLPFGLSVAPLVFTKIMKPVISHLRKRGYLSVIYLDDFLLFGDTYTTCQDNVRETCKLLKKLGFIINENKSQITPSQRCKFLGFYFDSVRWTVELTKEKKESIKEKSAQLKIRDSVKIREFAQFLGTLVSACFAVNYGWGHTKAFERAKYLTLRSNGGKYEGYMKVPETLSPDLTWWESKIESSINPIRDSNFTLEIFSDASLSGWGVFCKGERSHGHWNENERLSHIIYLELLAAFFGLKCFAKNLENRQILLRIDNTTAISYINREGGIQYPHLNKVTRDIWDWCENKNIWVFASYISSKMNVEADVESRRLEPETEFELKNTTFRTIVEKFGMPEIDLFASRKNAKCKKYISWRRDPGSVAVDAFTVPWNQYFYAFPPFSLILRTLQKIECEEAQGIVVVPEWPAQPWYPKFQGTSRNLAEHFSGCRQAIEQAFARRKLPETAIQIMTSSVSESSLKQYDGALKRWWIHCSENNISPYEATVSDILKFLAKTYDTGASHGSLNTLRSAISLIIGPEVGQDHHIKRFFKAVHSLRPTRPKYDSIWEPKIVLNYFKSLPKNENLSLKDLTMKLITLLALVTGHRMQTYSKINVENIQRVGNAFEIRIPDRIKTTGANRKQPLLIIPFYAEDEKLCSASALQNYLERTKTSRGSKIDLFLSFKKPFQAVSSQTLSRWVKLTLKNSGVNTDKFTAHSTRYASTSTAKRNNIDIETIRKTAGWTTGSETFAKFYHLNVSRDKDSYARAILNSQ